MTYFLKEVGRLLLLLFVASFLTFSLLYVSPGDAAELIMLAHDMIPTEESLAIIRQEYGLDKPFFLRYFDWSINALQGDFGYSHSAGQPVFEEFMRRIPFTLMLAGFSIAMLLFFSFALGIIAAMHKGRAADYIVMLLSSTMIAIPSFWMGLMLILLFVVKLGWFEITKMQEPANMVLAAAALALPLIGRYASLIRAGIVDQLSQQHVTGAKVRGVPDIQCSFATFCPTRLSSFYRRWALASGRFWAARLSSRRCSRSPVLAAWFWMQLTCVISR